jgi:mannose-6-phosphate isomerase-like protein (cupin superfamily)
MAPDSSLQCLHGWAYRNFQMAHPIDVDLVRCDWHSRGFTCDVWTDPPGQTWEDYTHGVDELVMLLDGDVEFEINGRIIQPAVGEELAIPAGVVHSVRNKGRVTSRWLYGYKRR